MNYTILGIGILVLSVCLSVVFFAALKYQKYIVRQEYQLQFEQWKRTETAKIKNKSTDTSRNVIRGAISEQLAPLIAPEMQKYNLSDLKFHGQPVDYLVFDGMSEVRDTDSEQDITIIFLDIKTGNAKLSPIQQKIKRAVEKGNVKWETVRV